MSSLTAQPARRGLLLAQPEGTDLTFNSLGIGFEVGLEGNASSAHHRHLGQVATQQHVLPRSLVRDHEPSARSHRQDAALQQTPRALARQRCSPRQGRVGRQERREQAHDVLSWQSCKHRIGDLGTKGDGNGGRKQQHKYIRIWTPDLRPLSCAIALSIARGAKPKAAVATPVGTATAALVAQPSDLRTRSLNQSSRLSYRSCLRDRSKSVCSRGSSMSGRSTAQSGRHPSRPRWTESAATPSLYQQQGDPGD